MKMNLWLFMGRLMERRAFASLNILILFIYRKVFPPVFLLGLRFIVGSARIKVRQSVQTGLYFNPFFSDLDLGVIFPEIPDSAIARSCRNYFSFLRYIFPFVGELEFFSSAEWARFQSLTLKNQAVFSFIRDLRKLNWLRVDYSNAGTEYQKYKIKRAERVLLARHGIQSTTDFRLNLSHLLARFPVRIGDEGFGSFDGVNTDHLGWSAAELKAAAPEDILWVLAGIVPVRGLASAADSQLAKLRGHPQIYEKHLDYLATEAIQIDAVFRARPQQFPWMGRWAEELRQWRDFIERQFNSGRGAE